MNLICAATFLAAIGGIERFEDPRKLALEIEAAGQRLAEDPLAVPEDHAVYVLTPAEVQFWQGDRERQHVRLRYRRSDNGWMTERLWP